MDQRTKEHVAWRVEMLLLENPPMLGEGYLEPGSATWIRVRNAYQRWLLMKLAPEFPDVPMVDLITDVIGPRIAS